ncbi:hypothetical protein BN1013_00689 [Candidatus Rubidus massiliensis]|nr:hypothetical protein BN1013_00689 [Candidatus Rubidus massiliensis]
MSKRPTISNDFLNEIDESPIDLLTKPVESHKEATQNSSHKKSDLKQSSQREKQSSQKERMTIQINKDTIERAKNAVYWTPGLTIAQLTEEALNIVLNEMEKERGEAFPKRKSELRPGRPLK